MLCWRSVTVEVVWVQWNGQETSLRCVPRHCQQPELLIRGGMDPYSQDVYDPSIWSRTHQVSQCFLSFLLFTFSESVWIVAFLFSADWVVRSVLFCCCNPSDSRFNPRDGFCRNIWEDQHFLKYSEQPCSKYLNHFPFPFLWLVWTSVGCFDLVCMLKCTKWLAEYIFMLKSWT